MSAMSEAERDQYRALREASRSATCARCAALGTRVGMRGEQFVLDVLCHRCFEGAPHRFKVTSAQDIYRDAIKAGAHPRFAARAAEVRGCFRWGSP